MEQILLNKKIAVRTTKECNSKIQELMTLFPDDYKTRSDVIRAGIFAVYTWKMANLKEDRKKC